MSLATHPQPAMAATDFPRTVSFTFDPAPIDISNSLHDWFEALYREALRGTTEHFRIITKAAAANGRPIKSYSLSRDAKLMFGPQFLGENAKRLPGTGSLIMCTTSATFIGRSYYRNESVFTYAGRKGGSTAPDDFAVGEIIAGSVLGFVFVEMTPSGGWTPGQCPEELVKGGWQVDSPLAAIPTFSYLTRDEVAADKYLDLAGASPLPKGGWLAPFNTTDSFGHVTARKRVLPFFDYVYSTFPNAVKRDKVNPRGISVAANSIIGYYVEFKSETKAGERCEIEAVAMPPKDGLVELRFVLQGDEAKGVLNRASMLLVAEAGAADPKRAVPITGRGRVMVRSVL